jgi:hypothetical protein
MDLLLTIPASSAENERAFFRVKLVKTDSRNQLSSNRPSQILRIQLQTPEIGDFDPTNAINKWLDASPRKRRATFTRPARKGKRLEVNHPREADRSEESESCDSELSDSDISELSELSEMEMEIGVLRHTNTE